MRRCRRATTSVAARPRPTTLRELRELLGGREAVRHRRRRRLEPRGLRRQLQRFAEERSCRSAPRSASRTCSTTAIRTTPATSASASTRSWPQRIKDADLILAIGAAPGRNDDRRLHAARGAGAAAEAGARPRRRRGARPRLPGRRCRSTAAWRTSPAALEALKPVDGTRGRRTARRRTPTTRQAASRGRCPATVQHGRGHRAGCTSACPTTRSSPTAPATSPAGCTASSSYQRLHAPQLAPTTGAMGYGVPAAVAAKLAAARPHGRVAAPATATS